MKNLLIPAVVIAAGDCRIQAQEFGLEYSTEWETNFKGDYNWCNLLKLSATVPVSPVLTLEASTISVACTGDPLIDDLQGYSNIEADDLPLAFAVLGASFSVKQSTFFLGIRNVNEDYFTSPVTSFFVNSSCGIYPTLSANYDIANYPLSSWCVHYAVELSDRLLLQTSLYEGLGHRRIAGHDNVFTFKPATNGLFSITSAEYVNKGSNYSLGCAVYYGVCIDNADGGEALEPPAPQAAEPKKKVSVAPWFNVEQRISDRLSLMLQGGIATRGECRYYAGLGATYDLRRVTLGLFTDIAGYRFPSAGQSGHSDFIESATELTCRIPLKPNLYIQPTVQLIHNNGIARDGQAPRSDAIALLRLSLNL